MKRINQQTTSHGTKRSTPHRRSGLAPLEFVLVLPLMLFVMALMINFGTVGVWKVRAHVNTRYASYRTLHLRSGQFDPNPPMWPRQPSISGGGGTDLDDVNLLAGILPPDVESVVNGPSITVPDSGEFIRVSERLEMADGVHNGSARLERQFPLLRGIARDDGRYVFNLPHNILDARWEFHDLGFGNNRSRRAEKWYDIDPEDFPNVVQFKGQLDAAAAILAANPLAGDLMPLDRDDDFVRYRGSAPDFYPRIGGMCEADPFVVRRDRRYRSLLQRIQRLPGSMGRSFRGLYQAEKDRLEALDPPPPGVGTLIADLQAKIDQLDMFLGSLPPQNR